MSNVIAQKPTAVSYAGVTSVSLTFGSACTSSSLLLGVLTSEAAGALGASDPTNGAWTQDVDAVGTGGSSHVSIFSKQNAASSALTVTGTSPASYGAFEIYEVTGAATSSALDVSGAQIDNNAPSITLNCAANDTIIAGHAGYVGVVGDTADTGFTIDEFVGGFNSYHVIESKADAGAAGNKTLTWNGSGANIYAAFAAAAYKTNAGGGTVSGSIAADESSDNAAISTTVTTGATVAATESSDTASISGAATTPAPIAATDSSDTAAISASVTTGASIAASDGADTDAIVAAIWTTAQIAAAESSDTAAISTSVTTGGAVAASESADNAAITADNQTTAAVAAIDSADNAAVTTSVTTGAAIAALDNSDAAAITVDANTGVTSAAVAATESADSTIVVAEATVGAAIAASESADTANISTQVIAVAAIDAAESSDAAAITAVVATIAQIDATESSDYGGSPDVPVVNVGSGAGVMNRRRRRAAQFAPDAFPAPAVFTITRAGIHAIESPDTCIITALQFLELGKSAGDIAELAAAHELSLKAAQEAEEAEFAEFFGAGGIVEQFMPSSTSPEVRAQSAGHGVVQRKRIEKEVIERDANGIPTKIIETEIVLFGPGEQELPIRRRVEKEVIERDADGVATKVIETEIAL